MLILFHVQDVINPRARESCDDSAPTIGGSTQYELNATTMGPNPDEKKALALSKDISALNEKLITAELELKKSLAQQGIPAYGMGGNGMMGGNGW